MRRAAFSAVLLALIGAAPAVEAKIALIGPGGAKGKIVRKDLSPILAVEDTVITEEDLVRGQKPPKGAKARAAWLAKLAESSSELVVRAKLRGKKLQLVASAQGS